jgi:hypothetical protein
MSPCRFRLASGGTSVPAHERELFYILQSFFMTINEIVLIRHSVQSFANFFENPPFLIPVVSHVQLVRFGTPSSPIFYVLIIHQIRMTLHVGGQSGTDAFRRNGPVPVFRFCQQNF